MPLALARVSTDDSMSGNDLSILSYKELQALASQYEVPGNIKKSLMVKIIQAKSCGNNIEVTKLLADLRKNRRKRTKRLKIMKSEDDVSLHMALCSDSPGLSTNQDHYLFPIAQQQQQQQYPFQWVGAEEEVATSKYEDIRCNLSYNDLRQFVFYTTQGVYSNCDTNNNSTLLDEIMDLRTENTVSNCQTTLDGIHVNGTIQQQQPLQQPTEESTSTKMSLLLKKMLQAPVGANLGEIASPVSTWAVDTYRIRDQPSPDNSETMTARSDINETDEIWQDSVTQTPDLPCVFDGETNYNDNPYYRRTDNNTYYRSLENGLEPNAPNYDQSYHFTFSPQADAQENCRSWLASNNLNITSSADYGVSPASQLAPVTSFQYQSPESLDMINPSPADSSNIIQSNANQQYYNPDHLYTGQNALLLESSDIGPDMQFDSSRFYTSTEFTRPQESQDYYSQLINPSYSNDFYESQSNQQHQQLEQKQQQSSEQSNCDYAQQLAAAPIYHIELDSSNTIVPYDAGYYQEQQQQQPSNQVTVAVTDPLQQVQDQQYESYASAAAPATTSTSAPVASLNNPTPTYSTGILDPYWPRWTVANQQNISSQTGGRILENTLNLCSSNYVDYTKLNETCCVFSNRTPVMTLRKGFNSVPTNFETRTSTTGFTGTEYRYHNFNSSGLLYNDSPRTDTQKNLVSTSSLSFSVCSTMDQQSEIII